MNRLLLVCVAAFVFMGASWAKTPTASSGCASLNNNGDICYLRQTDATTGDILTTAKCETITLDVSDKGACVFLQSCRDKDGTHGCVRIFPDPATSTACVNGTIGNSGFSHMQAAFVRIEGSVAPTSSADPAIVQLTCHQGR